jgi:hypothetical protein
MKIFVPGECIGRFWLSLKKRDIGWLVTLHRSWLPLLENHHHGPQNFELFIKEMHLKILLPSLGLKLSMSKPQIMENWKWYIHLSVWGVKLGCRLESFLFNSLLNGFRQCFLAWHEAHLRMCFFFFKFSFLFMINNPCSAVEKQIACLKLTQLADTGKGPSSHL